MQARTLTPAAIFGYHVRYVVPLFQRPYVWNEQDQWAPLWADVRAVAEKILEAPTGYGGPQVAPHFLGAIVLDQPPTPAGFIAVQHVIDGQQRLTTLQLLLDAAQWVAERHGAAMDAQALRVLVLNEPAIAQQQHEVFKVWPTDRDQEAFAAVMDNTVKVPLELASTPVAKAHRFFVETIEAWADITGVPEKAGSRIHALTLALREYLKIVVIDLERGDNAQVIFETLNHRGTPLLAADLIKNLVFQVAITQGLDAVALYRQHWRELDSDYWRQRVARGRQYVPRIDIFVHYWLVMRLLREVSADRIFVEFRDYLFEEQAGVEPLLAELSRDARIFAALENLLPDSVIGRFRYRILQAMDSAVVTPIMLWLLRWSEEELPAHQRDKALGALESWLVRRALCRLTSKDVNRLVLDLLRELGTAGPSAAGDVTEKFLLAQTADSRFWPSDKLVDEALRTAPLYKALLRARLRMLLEAVEDSLRSDKSEEGRCPRNLTVEHIMPRAWREHWGGGISDEAAAERDQLIHTLGNLTLVNNRLNPSLSNRPWTDQEAQARGVGDTGKRSELLKHSTLKICADLVVKHPDEWAEETIQARTAELVHRILTIWPKPSDDRAQISLAVAEKDVVPLEEETHDDAEQSGTHVSKYQPLTQWLRAQTADSLPLSFEDLEDVLGFTLPPSARNHPPYWYSTSNSLGKAIAAGGFKPTGANLTAERVVLVKRAGA